MVSFIVSLSSSSRYYYYIHQRVTLVNSLGEVICSGGRIGFARNGSNIVDGIGVLGALVGAQAHYARKTEGVAALVAGAWLYSVEGHLYHDKRLYKAGASEIADSMRLEPLGHLDDLGVCKARICLAHIEKLIVGSEHGERIVRQHLVALAVPPFDGGHDHIQGGKGALNLEPRLAPLTRRIGRA